MLTNTATDYPATERQKTFWKEYTDSGKQMILNISHVFDLEDPDEALVEKALRALTDRHESFRTIFALKEGGLKQVIYPADHFSVPLERMSCRPLFFAGRTLHRIIQQVKRTHFDLEKGPLVRFALVHLGNGRAKLVVAMQHIIADANSLQILKDDFQYYYRAFVDGQPAARARLTFQVKDFARWEQNYLNTRTGEKNLSYWRDTFNGNIQEFKVLKCWQGNRMDDLLGGNKNGGEYAGYIPQPLLEEVKALAFELKTSKLCIFYVSLFCLLYHLSGHEEIVVVVPISLRDRRELREVIGFMNTDICLRMKADEHATVRDMMTIASNKYFEALDHRHHRADQVLDKVHQYTAAVLNELPPQGEASIQNFKAQFMTKNNGRKSLYPLFFMLTEYKNGLGVDCMYNREIINDRKMPLVLEKYFTILESVVRNPSGRMSDLLSRL